MVSESKLAEDMSYGRAGLALYSKPINLKNSQQDKKKKAKEECILT